MKIKPVILSGGSGTRLWPVSRQAHPKQLISLIDDSTLLQSTVKRLEGFEGDIPASTTPIVVCNEEYRFLTAEQLRQIGVGSNAIVLEPNGRNTAPALTSAALVASVDDDAVLLVMPADHVVAQLDRFHQAMREAVGLALAGNVVTFGIVPKWPETGYGYIKGGVPLTSDTARVVSAFVEKPDVDTARGYIESGDYFWNSGIFVTTASTWLKAIGHYRPDILAACRSAVAAGNQDGDFFRLDRVSFEACPSESIDYAVLEKIPDDASIGIHLAVVPLDAGWSDVGAWDALWLVSEKDAQGNVARGDVLLHETSGSMVFSQDRLVTCIGVKDMVVVETPDAVMVTHKSRTQDVKAMVDRLKSGKRAEIIAHRKVHRPWGYYDSIDHGERFQVKRIVVNPGASLSLQLHHHRAEHWVVVRGTARVTRGDEIFVISENESTYIPIGITHRLENPGKLPLEIIEVQSGSYLGEDDIVRMDDTYGR